MNNRSNFWFNDTAVQCNEIPKIFFYLDSPSSSTVLSYLNDSLRKGIMKLSVDAQKQLRLYPMSLPNGNLFSMTTKSCPEIVLEDDHFDDKNPAWNLADQQFQVVFQDFYASVMQNFTLPDDLELNIEPAPRCDSLLFSYVTMNKKTEAESLFSLSRFKLNQAFRLFSHLNFAKKSLVDEGQGSQICVLLRSIRIPRNSPHRASTKLWKWLCEKLKR